MPNRYVIHSLTALATCASILAFQSCTTPTRPTPEPAASPALTCPAPQTVVSSTNQAAPVLYPKPTLAGGTLPITSSCTPETGSTFAIGSTTVSCTTVDAQQRSTTCSFSVTVVPATSLTAMRVLAFGDSITEGKTALGLLPYGLTGVGCPYDRPTSYPRLLEGLLRTQYPTQTLSATNCGFGGETAVEGVTRLPTGLVLASYDVVLLLEGANDLNEVSASLGTQAMAVDRISSAIVSMIRSARTGRTVFVGTLLPQRQGGSKAARPEWVEPVNNRLRSVVPAEGAVLVDLYQAFGASPNPYIDSDGLHPTLAGHQKIAETFFAAIRARLEKRNGS